LSFDVAASVRRLKPQRATQPLARRPDAQLTFVPAQPGPGPELLLDTCVYIDVLQGRTPTAVDDLLQLRILNHSTVALAELTHAFGRLDPADPRTRGTLRELSATVAAMPAHRLSPPSDRAFGEAGMLAGLVARLSGRASGVELLNDASLLLHAAETGCTLLTRNVADFDLAQQVAPGSNVLFYRSV
jgi:predicted nucleic acid-binding protein